MSKSKPKFKKGQKVWFMSSFDVTDEVDYGVIESAKHCEDDIEYVISGLRVLEETVFDNPQAAYRCKIERMHRFINELQDSVKKYEEYLRESEEEENERKA